MGELPKAKAASNGGTSVMSKNGLIQTEMPSRARTRSPLVAVAALGVGLLALPVLAQQTAPEAEQPTAVAPAEPQAAESGPSQEALKAMVESEGGAVFRGLDKITARVSTVYAPLDEVVTFGSLQFVTRHCNKRPPEETPEKTAFLEVVDVKPDQSEQELFTGWMFASSPALNALEHPVYDIWLIDCIIIEPEVPEEGSE